METGVRAQKDRASGQSGLFASLMEEQVHWYSNRSGSLLATIAKGEGAAGWNYAILKQDKKGEFQVCKVMDNFFDLDAAKVDLLLSMNTINIEHLELPALPLTLVAARS